MAKRKSSRKRQRARVAADIVGLISGVAWLVWMFSYSIAMLLFAICSALVAGFAAVWSRQETVASTKPAPAPKVPKVYKSKAQRARERRSAVLQGKIVSGRTRVRGGAVAGCNSKCQNSRTPKRWCRCPCGGQGHGAARRLSVAIPAAVQRQPKVPKPRPPKKRERQSPKARAVEPRSAQRAIRYRAKDGKTYTATATPRQIAELRRQGRYVGPAS